MFIGIIQNLNGKRAKQSLHQAHIVALYSEECLHIKYLLMECENHVKKQNCVTSTFVLFPAFCVLYPVNVASLLFSLNTHAHTHTQ